MQEPLILKLAVIVIAGVGAQWLAWITRLPSILFLLAVGIVLGPVTGYLDPDALFGETLLPAVSLAVALILYEGGLTLRFAELGGVGRAVGGLVVVGATVTWALSSLAAHWIFRLDAPLSALLGAILVVTGPTVIGPLLRIIRPKGRTGSILKWEGIVIDPVGALLAVLVFEAILARNVHDATTHAAYAIAVTTVAGGGLGVLAALGLTETLRRHWVPEFMQNAVSLMLVVTVFVVANSIQAEAGLLAATVMGMTLANQKRADIDDIVEFKENLRVLLIAALFVTLAAQLRLDDLVRVIIPSLLFLGVLVLLVRPVAVAVSTAGSGLTRRERAFIAAMAPRGIVAAAVASVFALRLQHAGYADAAILVPVTFSVIIGTVLVYGLFSPILARVFDVADPDPQGVLMVGAQPWVRRMAAALGDVDIPVVLVDSNRRNIAAARMDGLTAYAGSALAESAVQRWDLTGVGRLLAVTPNDWVNILATERFRPVFGRQHCYQLGPPVTNTDRDIHQHLRGRRLFGEKIDYARLERQTARGGVFKATTLTETFTADDFAARYGPSAIMLCLLDADHRLHIAAVDQPLQPQPGDTVISLVHEPDDQTG